MMVTAKFKNRLLVSWFFVWLTTRIYLVHNSFELEPQQARRAMLQVPHLLVHQGSTNERPISSVVKQASQVLPKALPTLSASSSPVQSQNDRKLGAIVILAPLRNREDFSIGRFCLLMRAVRSIDENINKHYGPYPIHLVVAKDHDLDPRGEDAEYTKQDRDLLQSWAPNSELHFEEINMYSQDAFEPGTSREEITKWIEADPQKRQEKKPLGYRSMCRLWSGRIQNMDFMKQYKYMMRVDDDSLVISKPRQDPFEMMQEQNLQYFWKRNAADGFGGDKLWRIASSHLQGKLDRKEHAKPFLRQGKHYYTGNAPYNNFHIAALDFWQSEPWMSFYDALERNHVFFQHSLGDANVHAIAIMLMDKVKMDRTFPYKHNCNDGGVDWIRDADRQECRDAAKQYNTTV